jgi:hypothetical protein
MVNKMHLRHPLRGAWDSRGRAPAIAGMSWVHLRIGETAAKPSVRHYGKDLTTGIDVIRNGAKGAIPLNF